MYNVILIDDEPWILEGLKRKFEWKKYNFNLTGTFSDSFEALEYIKTHRVELIISDVRMPGMTGLELIKYVHEDLKRNDICFMMISGFSEFEYVKKAMYYMAIDYLIKPIRREDTDRVLEHAYSVIEKKKMNQLYKRYFDIYENKNKINELICNEQISEKTEGMAVAYDKDDDKVEEFLYSLGKYSDIYMGNTGMVIIEAEYDILREIILTIKKDFADSRIGISSCCDLNTLCLKIVRQALFAYWMPFIKEKNTVYVYEKSDNKEHAENIYRMESIIKKGAPVELEKFLCEMKKQIKNFKEAFDYWRRAMLILDPDMYEQYRNNEIDWEQMVDSYKDFDDLGSSLVRMMSDIKQPKETKNITNGERIIIQMKQFIFEHMNESITLQSLADNFYISFRYAGDVFKRYSGESFIQYLTRIRIENAKKMLKDSKYSIEEICFMCGYHEYSYFVKVFKKSTGKTPYQYRMETENAL